MILSTKTDAELTTMFDALIIKMHAANMTRPRTTLTIAKARSFGAQLKEITTEMRKRADAGLSPANIILKMNNDLSVLIVGSVKQTFNQLGEIGGAAGKAVGETVGSAVKASGIGFLLVFGVVVVAVAYVWKK